MKPRLRVRKHRTETTFLDKRSFWKTYEIDPDLVADAGLEVMFLAIRFGMRLTDDEVMTVGVRALYELLHATFPEGLIEEAWTDKLVLPVHLFEDQEVDSKPRHKMWALSPSW